MEHFLSMLRKILVASLLVALLSVEKAEAEPSEAVPEGAVVGSLQPQVMPSLRFITYVPSLNLLEFALPEGLPCTGYETIVIDFCGEEPWYAEFSRRLAFERTRGNVASLLSPRPRVQVGISLAAHRER
jgi:hypothetical protein